IITISQNANDVKTLFSKDLTIENELVQIQNRLENIKNAAHENRSEQMVQYTNAIHKYIEQQFNKIENNPDQNEIDSTMENIRNCNKEYEVKLQQILNYKNEFASIIPEITNLIPLIKSKYGNNNKTIENELVQIQNRLENIKNAAHENRSEQMVQYTNAIHKYIEQQFNKIENNPDQNEIDSTMENIRNYNKEYEVKLQQILNYKNEFASIIPEITNLI
ncbi:hypothetical protein PCHDK_000564100, partial [Plasmodium chabaudi adami]